jgi:membrane-associated phospholipid phosphatase
MNKTALFQARWNIRALVTCNVAALVLLGLWLLPAGKELFTAFDIGLFHLLNQPLATSTVWRSIWAVGSMRPFDIVVGLILLTLLIRGNYVFERNQVRQAVLGIIAMMVALLVIRALFSGVCDHMGWQHSSPSLVVPDAVRLENLYPNIDKHLELKDESNQSFPGDHASVLLIWAMFMSLFARRCSQRLVIWGLVALFSLPRLVAGAHWGQDDYIGGVLMALLALGWGFYTPYLAKATALLSILSNPVFKLLEHIPILRRLSVVSG